jgi:nicotinic acid mononucleotide adenylyltransferase
MKDYKQFVKTLPNSTIVCALGDFNPPTTTHELLVKTVQVVSEQRKADHIIFTSPSSILQEEKKHQFLKLMFPKAKVISLGESFFSSVVKKLNEKYKRVIIIAGADQFDEFKQLKESAGVEVISIGTKDPDVASEKMKQYATKGLYEEFKELLPSTIRDIDAKRLMNEMRIGMDIEPIKEQLVLVKDKLREDYFNGKIFNVGDMVVSDGHPCEIVKRGSNHLLVKEQSGKLTSKWIQDVTVIKEGVIQQSGTDKIDTNAPQADTGAKQDQETPKTKTKGFLTFYNYGDTTKGDTSRSGNKNALGLENSSVVKEELDEAKKKVVCPDCGKNPCECGEERPGIGTENNPYNDPFFKEDFSDKEIDSWVDDLSEEELLGLDEHTDWDLVYEDTEEVIPPHPDEAQIDLMEVLSRSERIRGKIRLRRTQAKRSRSTKINVHRFAPPAIINKRARRLAIKLIKKRMLRGRNPATASVGDKERIEKAIHKNKALVDRVAQKLVVRTRRVEKSRMSKGKSKKGSMPSVF